MARNRRGFSQRALADALGVSPARVTAMKKAGMPVHSVEAAEAWRSGSVRQSAHSLIAKERRLPEAPVYPEDDEEDALDDPRDGLVFAFINLAIPCHSKPERYAFALQHLLGLLDDEQYDKVLQSGYVSQRAWDAVSQAWDQVYKREQSSY